MSLFWKFVAGAVDKGFAHEQAAVDEVAPTAAGRSVEDVKADLRPAMKRHRCTLSEAELTRIATKLAQGETVTIGAPPADLA